MEYRWISTKEALPELGKSVLWHSSDKYTFEYKIATLQKSRASLEGYSVDGSSIELYDYWMDYEMK